MVSAHPLASSIGANVMRKGGNAFDAAIATQLALAVVYPGAGNLGGGGFMVARMADGKSLSLDFRETNVLQALRAGIHGIHLTVNGMGERAGNAPLASAIAVIKRR